MKPWVEAQRRYNELENELRRMRLERHFHIESCWHCGLWPCKVNREMKKAYASKEAEVNDAWITACGYGLDPFPQQSRFDCR